MKNYDLWLCIAEGLPAASLGSLVLSALHGGGESLGMNWRAETNSAAIVMRCVHGKQGPGLATAAEGRPLAQHLGDELGWQSTGGHRERV